MRPRIVVEAFEKPILISRSNLMPEFKNVKIDKPVESKEQPATPLSLKSKKTLIKKIKEKPTTLLKPILVDAALHMHMFPKSINQKLTNLQLVYKEHQENESVALPLKQAISNYVESEMFKEILDYFKLPLKEEEWNSSFLTFLANRLKIKIEEEPLVEAAIKDGKIYWRIMKGETIVYDRQQVKNKVFDFNQQVTWRMPWQLFRTFKDSGKRSSSVAITQELFAAQFYDVERQQAANIWGELKQTGILNSRDRLSHGFRALSGQNLNLTLPRAWSYSKILNAIYLITNNPVNEEKIDAIPDAGIYRPERAKKGWAKTGRITNSSPDSKEHGMKFWDVAIYSDATAHRCTEEKTSLGDKTNHDHIPSGSALKEVFKKTQECIAWQKYNKQIEDKNKELKALEESHNTSMSLIIEADSTVTTRQKFHSEQKQMVASMKEKKKDYDEQISKLESERDQIITENDGKWWIITIPEKFHKQGATFLESKKDQHAAPEPHFLREVKAYLDMLEERGKEFFSDHEGEYLKALGAFRYLYRINLKAPSNLAGKHNIGGISQTLFNDPKTRHAIDQLFLERIKRFLIKQEGTIDATDTMNASSVRKPLA